MWGGDGVAIPFDGRSNLQHGVWHARNSEIPADRDNAARASDGLVTVVREYQWDDSLPTAPFSCGMGSLLP